MINAHYKGSFWIKAEIAKLNYYPKSGHCFPDLVEKKDGSIIAEMRSTIWRIQYQRINQAFIETLQTPLKEGMSVLLKGKLDYHQSFGFSIQISHIDPSFTLGEMASEKQKCILDLKKEGFFYRNKELKFPDLPKRLAIISYNTSKGYQDFLEIINTYSSQYAIHYQLFPSLLQGDKAIDSMLSEFTQIESRLDKFDLVLIIRGGGGDVGMNCYDNYKLAKRVATFPLPVLTGIGHSTNETVVEMVAHKNSITPTDLAYEILQHFKVKDELLQEVEKKLHRFSLALLQAKVILHESLQRRLVQQTKMLLKIQSTSVTIQNEALHKQLGLFFKRKDNQLELANNLLTNYPDHLLTSEQANLSDIKRIIEQKTNELYFNYKQNLYLLETKIDMLSPERIFKRGFSITTKNGQPINSVDELNTGDRLKTTFLDGSVTSKVD